MKETPHDKYLRKFVRSRDEAFTRFVLDDDWDAVLKHFKKFGMDLPTKEKETVAKAGVYKAVQECTNIPIEVKAEAARKCVLLGFRPTMFRLNGNLKRGDEMDVFAIGYAIGSIIGFTIGLYVGFLSRK